MCGNVILYFKIWSMDPLSWLVCVLVSWERCILLVWKKTHLTQ